MGYPINKLEKIINVFSRIVQSLLPGTSGSAARGTLGSLSIKAEISKRKLYFLGRIINSSLELVHRKLFVRRLIKWKWRSKKITGFIPNIIKILEEFELLGYVEEFIRNDCFPSKKRWKKIVNDAIYKREESIWFEKINQKSVLKLYLCAHPSLQLSKWYQLWDYSPTDSQMVVDVIRLLCGSLKINNDRLGNTGTQSGTCSACARVFSNPIHHALLYCLATGDARENWWTWIMDNLPVTVVSFLNSVEDSQLIRIQFGDLSSVNMNIRNSFDSSFWLQTACYISYCVQNSVFDPLE